MLYAIAAVVLLGLVLGRWFFYASAQEAGRFMRLWDEAG
jgi:hypothetical protein